MNFSFTVEVEVTRIEGKFATRDEMEGQIASALDDANPGSLDGDNGGSYEITDWSVMENTPMPKVKAKKAPTPVPSAEGQS